jgi:hypothetical protein
VTRLARKRRREIFQGEGREKDELDLHKLFIAEARKYGRPEPDVITHVIDGFIIQVGGIPHSRAFTGNKWGVKRSSRLQNNSHPRAKLISRIYLSLYCTPPLIADPLSTGAQNHLPCSLFE